MAARFWVGGTASWTAANTANWAATSGGAGGVSVPVDGDTVTFDALSGGGVVTVGAGYNPTVTSITMGAFTGTLDFATNNNSPTMDTFNCSGTGTRTLNMGSGTWTLRGNNATLFTIGTTTNLTLNIGTCTINATYAGAVGNRTFNSGDSGTFRLPPLNITAGTDNINLSGGASSAHYAGVSFTGFSGNFDLASSFNSQNYYGNLTLSSTMTIATGTGKTLNFVGTGSMALTCNGRSLAGAALTVNGVGGTLTLQDALTIGTSTLTLTNGTFDANNFNVTCGIFSSSNSNVRTLTMGSGTWTLTGSGATIWNTATSTNMTFSGTGSINCTYSGGTGTRTFASSLTFSENLLVSAGTDIFTFTSSPTVGDLNFTGFAGTYNSSTINVSGNLTFGSGMSVPSGGSTITLVATTSKTISTNNVDVLRPVTLDGVGGTWILQDNLNMSSLGSSRNLTLTNGTFDANNKNVSVPILSSSNSNVRTLTMGSGTWTLTGTGTVWNTATTTNLTLNAGTSTVVVNDSSASSKTIASGVSALNNLTLTGGGTGTFIIGTVANVSTFNTISVPTPGSNVQVFAGKTLVVSALRWNGVLGNLNTFTSTTNGTPWFLVAISSNTVNQNFISLRDSYASGNTSFFAGPNSTNVSNNSGWEFFSQPSRGSKIIANGNRVDFGIMFNSKTKKFIRVKTPKQRANFKEQQQPTQGKKRLTSAVKLHKTPQTILTRTKSPAEQMPVVIYPTAMGTTNNKE